MPLYCTSAKEVLQKVNSGARNIDCHDDTANPMGARVSSAASSS